MFLVTEQTAIKKLSPQERSWALRPPKSVKIEISPRRPETRRDYYAPGMGEAQPDIDFRFFQRITREMREAGVEEMGVSYLGESFENSRLLVDCIAYLKSELRVPFVIVPRP